MLQVLVFEAKTGKAIPHTLEASYPTQKFGGWMAPEMDADENTVRARLLANSAQQILWLFVDHLEPSWKP
jgi:hypothetical protein